MNAEAWLRERAESYWTPSTSTTPATRCGRKRSAGVARELRAAANQIGDGNRTLFDEPPAGASGRAWVDVTVDGNYL